MKENIEASHLPHNAPHIRQVFPGEGRPIKRKFSPTRSIFRQFCKTFLFISPTVALFYQTMVTYFNMARKINDTFAFTTVFLH